MITRNIIPAAAAGLLLAGCMGIKPPLDLRVPETVYETAPETAAVQQGPGDPEHLVRVTVAVSTDSIRIASAADLKQRTRVLGKSLMLRPGADGTVIAGDDGYKRTVEPATVFFIDLEPSSVCTVGSKAYAGRLQIIPGTDTVSVVNIIGIEEYLKGVLPLEMGKLADKDSACLKAQAVAARTYALFRLADGSDDALAADVMDQMYGGASSYFPSCSKAVEATRGEVLTCDGQVVKANYFSTCGGKTELPENIWPDRRPGCFVCVEDTFCRLSRHYRWEEKWSRREMERLLYVSDADSASDDTVRVLKDMYIKNTLPSGRVDTLVAVLDGDSLVLVRDRLRWTLRRPVPRAPILRSTLFTVALQKDAGGAIDSVTVKGGGNGHGAGMCQWGAIGRGRAGQGYREILKHFYPNMKLEKQY